ncbi:MAG: HAD family hydrolase [Thermoflexales bacterium]|nr:HAD family hydrolase [Thermoflexales bacterium]MCS7324240.1 HAD family hydrolase [Thermoflexales bacterium]MCX7939105.1 HAD family hydrolase [Thermoflexales bacterium]MDW8054465.1 HAD family hydrolase [Anaerolineae bacterium]MDW8292745.1 HAD family hydrolase [Anaerolineae bacterium]
MVRAVIFDLDGTLRANQPEGFEAFVEYAGRVGIQLTERQIKICEREAHRYWASAQADVDLARYDKRSFWVNYNQILLNAMNVRNCEDCAQRIQDFFEHYEPQDVVFADTRPVLTQLKRAGYILGLVSNREEALQPIVEQYGFTEFFDFTLSAGEAGCYKPDPRIFYRALELAGGLDPEEAVYIGDNFFADVVGPLNIGMDAILVDPRDVFERYYTRRVKRLREVLALIPVHEWA